MSSKLTDWVLSANEDSDPHAGGTAPSTNAHYRRMKKFRSSTAPPVPHYERCGYTTGFSMDAEDMYSFASIGAPENGDFGDFYGVSNFCMAEDRTEEFVLQFLWKKPDSYVNVAVTFVNGLSENYDGSVMFDGGQYARGSASGIPHEATAEDERFEIGMKIDFTWGYDYLHTPPKLVKCKGLSFDMPGFDMEIVGNYDPSTNQLWDDKSRDFFNQTFNFRMDEGTQECYIRFARNAERARGLEVGDHTIVTRDFQLRPDSVDGSNGISLDFTVRHRSRAELAHVGTSSQRPEPGTIANKSSEDSNPPHWQAAASKDPAKQHPRHKKEIRFFDHPEHKLVLKPEYYYKRHPGSWCNACKDPIDSTQWVYGCPKSICDYDVHASCGDIPRTLQHPSHSKHAVKLRKLEDGAYKICDVCKESVTRGLHYHCAVCDFDAHPVCPRDMVEEGEASEEEEALDEEREQADDLDPAPVEETVKDDEEDEEWDASAHMGMNPEEYLAYLTIKNQQQSQLLAFQLNATRQTCNMIVSSGRMLANLAPGPKTCYKGCWSGCCTC